jgi:threonine dehydrogenase-like Zn-dependent dehydrogenase
LIFVGLVPGQIAFEDPLLHGRELTVMGSRNATAEDLETVIRLMEHRDIQVSSWVTHRASAGSHRTHSQSGWTHRATSSKEFLIFSSIHLPFSANET